jgi:hypothetical protein
MTDSQTLIGESLVQTALGKLGVPYVWVTAGPETFDCSGFTWWVACQVLGPQDPELRSSHHQVNVWRSGGHGSWVMGDRGDAHDPLLDTCPPSPSMNSPSVGLMQAKPWVWQYLVSAANAYEPGDTIRLGVAVLAHLIERHGSWVRAIAEGFHPGVRPNGTTPSRYVEAVRGLLGEIGHAT